MHPRVHLFGIRHHGPGSAALLCQALDALDPACVLVEGPPEGDALIPFIASPDLVPPVAMLMYAADEPSLASFYPFAEFSPEWQAIRWALLRQRPVRFIDSPAAVTLALRKEQEETSHDPAPDALDLLAAAGGFEDGETFWNSLVEQVGSTGGNALAVFASIELAMTEARAQENRSPEAILENSHREAFMRTSIRAALKEHEGPIAVVVGAWHVGGLRENTKPADDRAAVKDLARLKVAATWIPWTDRRLSALSGYGAGVISPGWYRHLWQQYTSAEHKTPQAATADWQSRAAYQLRSAGHAASTASAIEAARLSIALASLRELPVPGLAEMRDASLATLCGGNPVPLLLLEQNLYIGNSIGQIGDAVPQNPLARDLTAWQKKTRLKPLDIAQELKVDLRSESGLLRSTLLHRLNLIGVPWGQLLDAQSGRGTFRELWTLHWKPEFAVELAEAVLHGITIEQAAAQRTLTRAGQSTSISELAGMVQQLLIADLPDAASACIDLLQAQAVHAVDITMLMLAVTPLIQVLRYGTARQLPESALRSLIHSLSVEINAGVRIGSRGITGEASAQRLDAMAAYDAALALFADEAILDSWRAALRTMVEDSQVSPAIAGMSLRRLHESGTWPTDTVATEFSRRTSGHSPADSGAFLEGFLRGGAEVLLQDDALLNLLDTWLCDLTADAFVESLPLLRRSLSSFDEVTRRRLLDKLQRGPQQSTPFTLTLTSTGNAAFDAALPLLHQILGWEVAP